MMMSEQEDNHNNPLELKNGILRSNTAGGGGGYSTVFLADAEHGRDGSTTTTSAVIGLQQYGHEEHRQRNIIRILSAIVVALLASNVIVLTGVYKSWWNGGSSSDNGEATSSRNSTTTSISWLPLPSSHTVLTKIAFGSCSRQDMPQPYWDTLALDAYRPELLLLMGDNVYGDCDEPTCQRLRDAYRDFGNHPSVQGAAKLFPVYATLDDHDYGQGDCYVDNPYKETARLLFREFFNLTTNVVGDDLFPVDGVYRSQSFGPKGQRLQIILLDTRYNRSPFAETGNPSAPYRPPFDNNETDTPQQIMLGELQWQWLADVLQEPADLRIIVSSIQVLNDGLSFEGWRHLPKERERLYQLIQGMNVILLSGDRHVGGFYATESDPPLREVTASAWTHTIPFGAYGSNCSSSAECDETDPRRIGDFVRANHFGSMEIDWEQRTFRVALRRTETTYGVAYFHDYETDAGFILQSMNYTFY